VSLPWASNLRGLRTRSLRAERGSSAAGRAFRGGSLPAPERWLDQEPTTPVLGSIHLVRATLQ
jgi:hypothetical protein